MGLIQGTRGLSGNALKLIACVFMVIDHVGVFLLPQYYILRVLGRIAFPIFAFMIAEGARHTKSRLRYFLTVFISAVTVQTVYHVAMHSLEMSIFVTFSLSLPLIYALDFVKRTLIFGHSAGKSALSIFGFVLAVLGAYCFCKVFSVDYGILGVMTPVVTSLFMMPKDAPEEYKRFDELPVHVAACGIALLLLSGMGKGLQSYALLALPLLLLYSGERGKLRLKYFFYLFYPLHLVLIWGISLLIR